MKSNTVDTEVIKARTPIYLASAGVLLALIALVPWVEREKANAAFGLAGTAIAGAAGLAQTNGKQEQNSTTSIEDNEFYPPVKSAQQQDDSQNKTEKSDSNNSQQN